MDILFSPIKLNELEILIEKSVSRVLDKAKQPTPTDIPPPQEQFLDVKQAAKLFGVSTVTIWQFEKQKLINSYRIGRLKRFKQSELLASPKLIQRQNDK